MNERKTTAPILSTDNLSMVFPTQDGDGLGVLERVSFSVYPQEFVCIVGPSGSGKTTLLRVLSGLRTPTGGRILFEGELLEGPRRGIGNVFQDANLMPWRTVRENITLPLEMSKTPSNEAHEKASSLINLVGLDGFEDTLPRDLSGGMAQRVAIARALAHDPHLLLLDEPFGSLDALTREYMRSELLRIWQVEKKTVMMVTHSINEALYLADRVIVLSDRPARIILDMDVDLPRPREAEMMYTQKFGEMAQRLRQEIARGTKW